MSAETLYAAVSDVLKKLLSEAIKVEKCAKTVQRTTEKMITHDKMEEILAAAKTELQELVLDGVSQIFHNDEVLEGLTRLKSLIEKSSREDIGWRPSGIPSDDITGHLQPVMLENEENLNRLRNRLEAEMERKRIIHRDISEKLQKVMEESVLHGSLRRP